MNRERNRTKSLEIYIYPEINFCLYGDLVYDEHDMLRIIGAKEFLNGAGANGYSFKK